MRHNIWPAIVGSLALAGCSHSAPFRPPERTDLSGSFYKAAGSVTRGSSLPDGVTMDVYTFGLYGESHWTIRPDGSGDASNLVPDGPRSLERRQIPANPTRYGEVQAMLAAAEAWVTSPLKFGRCVTDFPKVTISWTSGMTTKRLQLDYGCEYQDAPQLTTNVLAVWQRVMEWSERPEDKFYKPTTR